MDRTMAVLVVDDDPGMRRLVRHVLEPLGCRVRTASTGRAARAELRKRSFDFLVLDFHLPDTTGDQLMGLLDRDLMDRTAVILVSGGTADEINPWSWAGRATFLAKPLSVEDLQSAFRGGLQRSQGRRRRGSGLTPPGTTR